MYCERDFRTKKELKEAVARGERLMVFQPGGVFKSLRKLGRQVRGWHHA